MPTYFIIQLIFTTIMVPLHFLVLFMSQTVLFQLTFTFIYSTFSKKIFSFNKISESQIDPKFAYMLAKHTLGICDFFFAWIEESPYFLE